MKVIKWSFFLVILLWNPLGAASQDRESTVKDDPTLRIIVVGNSFSRNATEFLPALAEEAGHKLVLQKAEISGGSIKEHWEAVQAFQANNENSEGKPYKGKSLKEILQEGNWDMITFQQASTISADIGTYLPYLDSLVEYAKEWSPSIEVVIHQTWSYRVDAPYWSRYRGEERAQSSQEMWKKSRAVYHAIAERYDAQIIPTGDGFWEIDSDPEWGYKKDANFDFKRPSYPKLPDQEHSLHTGYTWSPAGKFKLDSHHANNAGRYLGALIWYGFLFRESPKNLHFLPDGVSKDFALKIREVAGEIVRQSKDQKSQIN